MEQKLINPLNAELNPICHLLALLGGATIVVVSRLRVKGEYLVRNTTNIRTDGIFYDLKLHVSAFIGHLQVSTIL